MGQDKGRTLLRSQVIDNEKIAVIQILIQGIQVFLGLVVIGIAGKRVKEHGSAEINHGVPGFQGFSGNTVA